MRLCTHVCQKEHRTSRLQRHAVASLGGCDLTEHCHRHSTEAGYTADSPAHACKGVGKVTQSHGRTLVDRLRPRIAVVNAGVEPTIALDRQPGCEQLGIPLQVNEVKEVPGRRPAAEVQRVQPERLVRDEYVMVIHDDALRCRPQPLRGRESEGGSQRGGRCAVALNANAPSHPTVATVNNLPPTLCFFLQLKRSCLRNRT